MSEYPTRDAAVRDRGAVATRRRPVAAAVLGLVALAFVFGGIMSLPMGLAVAGLGVALGVAAVRAARGRPHVMRLVAEAWFAYFALSLIYGGIIHFNLFMLVGGLVLGGIELLVYKRYARGRRAA